MREIKSEEITSKVAKMCIEANCFLNDDIKNARRCAEYAVSLNKKNTEARFLLAKIKQL